MHTAIERIYCRLHTAIERIYCPACVHTAIERIYCFVLRFYAFCLHFSPVLPFPLHTAPEAGHLVPQVVLAGRHSLDCDIYTLISTRWTIEGIGEHGIDSTGEI